MERLKITSSRHVERHAPQIPAGKKKIKVELNMTLIIPPRSSNVYYTSFYILQCTRVFLCTTWPLYN